MLKEKFVLFLVTVSALLLSASAAFFSVYGLSKVFAGAGISVIIMASVLEGSKLIAAYSLHQNKDILPTSLKTYLSIAIVVLMLITSAGIYGFLSNAYQITSNKNNIAESKINIVRAKSNNLTTRLKSLEEEKESIIKDIAHVKNIVIKDIEDFDESLVLWGCGAGLKNLGVVLRDKFGKTCLDIGSVLDAWVGKRSRTQYRDGKLWETLVIEKSGEPHE